MFLACLIFWKSEPQRSNKHGFYKKTRPYTWQHQSRAGGHKQYGSWAGAVTTICSPFNAEPLKKQSHFRRTTWCHIQSRAHN